VKINSLVRHLVLAVCVCISAEMAAQNTPVSPIQGFLAPVLVTEAPQTPVTPDEHPLSGGQILGIGSWGPRHSFLTPSLRLSETLDSNPLLQTPSDGGYRGFTNVGGGVQWMQYLGRDAEIRYAGALRYDTMARLQGYSPFINAHSAAISKVIPFRTWNLLIDDEAQYSDGSNFGAAGLEGMDLLVTQTNPWGGLPNLQLTSTSLQPNLTPNQSILTARVGRIANTTLIEADAHIDARDTATLAASYGLLHFNSSLLADTGQTSFVAGYNRTMTVRNSIGLEGAFTRFNFQDPSSSISTEYFSLLYARRISGRSAIEVGGGPQITQSLVSRANQTYLGWQGRATVQYRTRTMNLSAVGLHAVSGGAGVLDGVTSTTGQGTVEFVAARYWSMSLNSGVSRNQQLNSNQRYEVQFAGIALHRKTGPFTNLFLSYDFQRQTTSSVCTGPICGYVGMRNVFGIGFAWTYHPIGVE